MLNKIMGFAFSQTVWLQTSLKRRYWLSQTFGVWIFARRPATSGNGFCDRTSARTIIWVNHRCAVKWNDNFIMLKMFLRGRIDAIIINNRVLNAFLANPQVLRELSRGWHNKRGKFNRIFNQWGSKLGGHCFNRQELKVHQWLNESN